MHPMYSFMVVLLSFLRAQGDTEAGKDLAKQLNTELKAHRKVNTNKADKEAGY
jgi:hypothetical protein